MFNLNFVMKISISLNSNISHVNNLKCVKFHFCLGENQGEVDKAKVNATESSSDQCQWILVMSV